MSGRLGSLAATLLLAMSPAPAGAQSAASGSPPSAAASIQPPPPVAPPVEASVEPHRYGLGRWEGSPIAGFSAAPGAGTVDVGLRLGDVVGRSELLVLGGFGVEGGWNGLSIAYGYHGLPVDLTVHLYGIDTSEPAPLRRAGGALVAEGARWAGRSRFAATAGVLADVPWGPDTEPSRVFGFAGVEAAPRIGEHTAGIRAEFSA